MTLVDNRALTLGHRLARLLTALNPDPAAPVLLRIPIRTHDDAFEWGLGLSEAAVEELAVLVEGAGGRQRPTRQPVLKLVKR